MESNDKFKYILIGIIICIGLVFINSAIQKASGTETNENNLITEKQPIQVPYTVTEYYNETIPYYETETYTVQVPYTDYERYNEN